MVLPTFFAVMFDFGGSEVPDHVDDDTEWYDPAEGTWSVVEGHDPDSGMELACWVQSLDMAELLAQARLRKQMGMSEVWVIHPDGQKTRILSDAAFFDAAGSEVELAMASTS